MKEPHLALGVRILHCCLVLSNLIHLSQDALEIKGSVVERTASCWSLWNPISLPRQELSQCTLTCSLASTWSKDAMSKELTLACRISTVSYVQGKTIEMHCGTHLYGTFKSTHGTDPLHTNTLLLCLSAWDFQPHNRPTSNTHACFVQHPPILTWPFVDETNTWST